MCSADLSLLPHANTPLTVLFHIVQVVLLNVASNTQKGKNCSLFKKKRKAHNIRRTKSLCRIMTL